MTVRLRMPFLLFVITFGLMGFQAQAAECAFGKSTADLKDLLGAPTQPKVWAQGPLLSLNSQERIESLSPSQRRLLLDVLGGRYDSEKEAIDQIASSEGYILFFSNTETGKEYALLANYPGDNEFGAIVEIKYEANDTIELIAWVAVVTDGDLESCKVY